MIYKLYLARALLGWIDRNKKYITQNTQSYYITHVQFVFKHCYIILFYLNSFKSIVEYDLKELYSLKMCPIVNFLT